jgi:hypothetical protein
VIRGGIQFLVILTVVTIVINTHSISIIMTITTSVNIIVIAIARALNNRFMHRGIEQAMDIRKSPHKIGTCLWL